MSLLYWILAILMLGAIVTLHELGHFLAARLCGIRVAEFAVGYGPKLLSRATKTGLVVSLRALPLGGYCRFLDDEEGGDDALNRQPLWRRAVMTVAGPLTNVVTAILLFFLLYAVIGLLTVTTTIGQVMPGLPAERAGVLAGDTILAVDGVPVASSAEASQAILNAGDRAIELTLRRGEETANVSVAPEWQESEGRSMIGVVYQTAAQRLPLGESVAYSLRATGEMSAVLVRVLGEMIFQGEGVENLSGPVGTVVAIKEETEAGGLRAYVQLAAFISVNLGVFNLLPVPGLDGSKLILYLVEAIRRKPLNRKVETAVTLAGFALLMGLMAVVMVQDIARLIP